MASVWAFLVGTVLAAHCANATVRYLDVEGGSDSSDCLEEGSVANACQSLGFALTGNDSTVNVEGLHLFILPGVYYYGDSEIRVSQYSTDQYSQYVLLTESQGQHYSIFMHVCVCSCPVHYKDG